MSTNSNAKMITINGKLYQIVYKVVTVVNRMGKRPKLVSSNIKSKSLQIDYTRKHKWISPTVESSKIFVFDSLENAMLFSGHADPLAYMTSLANKGKKIFVALAEAPTVGNKRRLYSLEMITPSICDTFWKTGKSENLLTDVDDGVLFADRIMLIEELDLTKSDVYKIGEKLTNTGNISIKSHANRFFSQNYGGKINDGILEYKLNKWVSPKIKNSKVFTYLHDVHQRATNVGSECLFYCILKNPVKTEAATPRLEVKYAEKRKELEAFWATFGTEYKGHTGYSMPSQTHLCDAVYPFYQNCSNKI